MTANKYTNLCIGVTGLNANDNPGPGVAVIRALKEGLGAGVKIIGLSYESLEPGIYMHYLVDKTYQVPYPTAGTENLIERIRHIHEKEGLDMIIPNFDAELYNFIKIAPQLKKMGIHTLLPSIDQLLMRDKVNLAAFGRQNNFHVPGDYKLSTEADLKAAAGELSFPLVIKGKFYGATVAYTLNAALNAFHQLGAAWGYPVIAQQYIKGTEINIAALGDGKGNNISIVPMRKLYITDKGKAWAGVTIEDPALIKLANSFAKATHWNGPYEMEIMRDGEDHLFILEINPRFPAWIYLAAAAGQNQPVSLVKMAMGEDIIPFNEYEAGKLFIRHSWDDVVDISEFQQFSALGEL
ncbi:carbamoyl-phosphate synthase large subunit [Mucilaginibacter frigoritolerans]|uniref:Carbamoyl-phosphate synthase large subunit n=1 Tax=Mucilaginibacter frigoritolerans TaxID=652788 RepID=A0A562U9D5_9SPHI|nr:ATP-grasp domain-containing protein [Mucilaginibacter frigoritolerans]TWJ02416.1 carbamoyl-phosphate synthase large subunit [Mucilaginibacter frigoritolerans]